MAEGVYLNLLHDAVNLFAVWPSIDFESLAKFAQDRHQHKLSKLEFEHLQKTVGVDREKFCVFGQAIVEMELLRQLSTRGYNGQERERLLGYCVEAVNKYLSGEYSAVLIGEWMDELYERYAHYAKQPLRLRVEFAAAQQKFNEMWEKRCSTTKQP